MVKSKKRRKEYKYKISEQELGGISIKGYDTKNLEKEIEDTVREFYTKVRKSDEGLRVRGEGKKKYKKYMKGVYKANKIIIKKTVFNNVETKNKGLATGVFYGGLNFLALGSIASTVSGDATLVDGVAIMSILTMLNTVVATVDYKMNVASVGTIASLCMTYGFETVDKVGEKIEEEYNKLLKEDIKVIELGVTGKGNGLGKKEVLGIGMEKKDEDVGEEKVGVYLNRGIRGYTD